MALPIAIQISIDSCIKSNGSGPTIQYLLNNYPGASAAYSLRKLRSAYAGSAIRVRRSSDNAEQDIGFSGVNLDTTSLSSFVGVASGYVTKWYDQSGSARDAIQATAGNQPRIVNAGTIETQNSKPTIRFLSASTTYFSITNNATLTALSIFTPFLYTASTQNNTRFFSINATGGNDYDGYIPMIQFNASNNWGSYASGAFRAYSNSLANTFQLWTNIETGTDIKNYKNGANLASFPFTLSRVINNMVIGWGVFASPVDGRFDGNIPEMVIYQSDQSSNQTGIESNINTYYTIY